MRCDPVGDDKPQVWKDDDGWICTQNVYCLTCNNTWSDYLAEGTTWTQAMQAVSDAREVVLPNASLA